MLARSIGLIKQTNLQILGILRADSEVLYRIQMDFHALVRVRRESLRPIAITCFFEELPLPGIGMVCIITRYPRFSYSSLAVWSLDQPLSNRLLDHLIYLDQTEHLSGLSIVKLTD